MRVAGFSLIELLLVLVMIAVLAALGATRYANAAGNQSLEAAARRLSADLELARVQAVTMGSSRTVRFVTGTGRYTLDNIADLDHPGQTYAVDLAAAPYEATIGTVNMDGFNGAAITFDAYGRPVLGSGAASGARLFVAIQARGRTLYVLVDSTTGYTRVDTTVGN